MAAVVVLAVLSSVVAAAAADGARGAPGEVPQVAAGGGERPARATPAADGPDSAPAEAFVPGRAGEVLPVLPFGTGLACLGLGIGALGLRLRRA